MSNSLQDSEKTVWKHNDLEWSRNYFRNAMLQFQMTVSLSSTSSLAYAPYGWVRRGLQIIVISRKKTLSSRCQSCMAEEPHLTIRQFKQQTKNGKQQQNDSKVITYGITISCTLLIVCLPIIMMTSCWASSIRQPLGAHLKQTNHGLELHHTTLHTSPLSHSFINVTISKLDCAINVLPYLFLSESE